MSRPRLTRADMIRPRLYLGRVDTHWHAYPSRQPLQVVAHDWHEFFRKLSTVRGRIWLKSGREPSYYLDMNKSARIREAAQSIQRNIVDTCAEYGGNLRKSGFESLEGAVRCHKDTCWELWLEDAPKTIRETRKLWARFEDEWPTIKHLALKLLRTHMPTSCPYCGKEKLSVNVTCLDSTCQEKAFRANTILGCAHV